MVKQLSETIADCERCGRPCKVNPLRDPAARLLVHAVEPEGLCATCAMTQFLLGVEPIKMGIERHGPAILLNPAVRQQFAVLMAVGHADARPEEIDWQAMVDNWNLPFKQRRSKRK